MLKKKKRKREKRKTNEKKIGAAGFRTRDLWVKKQNKTKQKNSIPLRHSDLHVIRSQECVCTAIFVTKVEISTSVYCIIARHNKHSNFYRTVNSEADTW
jgi:hypothetical protein